MFRSDLSSTPPLQLSRLSSSSSSPRFPSLRSSSTLENSQVVGKGYAEVIIDADEVAVAASPSGTAHALVNVDPIRSSYFIGCQDSIVNYSNSSTDFNVWKDL
uniref:Uncharacterized protein n=1 Tax=Quercus lobata TaxID=97700 RepID=A0A7N2R5U2_QUELO